MNSGNPENCQEKQDNISIRTVPTTEEITGRFPTLETVEIRGREQFYKMRIRWSWCLIGILWFEVISTLGLVVLIGLGWLSLDSWVLETYILKFLGEVIGLPFFVIKFLFRDVSFPSEEDS